MSEPDSVGCEASRASPRASHGWLLAGICLALVWPIPDVAADQEPEPAAWLRLAVERLCGPDAVDGHLAQEELPGAWLLSDTSAPDQRQPHRITQAFALPGGHELRIIRAQPGGRLRRFSAEFHAHIDGTLRPTLLAIADGRCAIQSARRIAAAANGISRYLQHLDADLRTLRWTETLQAPWPDGTDPGGPRVAIIDSGLAYDLPQFRDRLARRADGRPLGYDFWDMDAWPYDGDVSRGPFLPIRHGTPVASVLVREAPTAALVPLRYPRPDMTRMADAVAFAAKAGTRILAMPLGSRTGEQWNAFAGAMRETPTLLAIVSAGNDGRDIDKAPIWPAALDLDNMIVVTSADASGRLARGSNWGRQSVDLMVPAENQAVFDFRGNKARASGSSYAVPRVAALAARLVAADPSISVADLKAKIFAHATASPFERDVVRIGWIPDPLAD